jgi:RNA polymerase sigma-70 factor (ECF subfamily)
VSEEERIEELRLIAAAAAGDGAAFEQLYHAHRDFVLRVAERFGATNGDGHDVLQEVFLYLIKKLPTLVLTARLATLLYTVTKHLALKRKPRAGHLSLQQDLNGNGGSTLPAPDHDPDAQMEVQTLLTRLPEAQREVVALRFLEEFTLDEIGAALDIPVGTVKSRLHNALEILREEP